MKSKYMNVKRVARFLNIDVKSVRRLISAKKLKAVKVDGKWQMKTSYMYRLKEVYDNRPGHKQSFKWVDFMSEEENN